MKNKNSPVTKILYEGFELFIKRDDLLDKDFSGNKARKFHYFLEHDFTGLKKIISYGSAQANSLYSLSVLANIKGVELDFYVHTISSFLKENPNGNYAQSLKNGANIIELDYEVNKDEYIKNKILPEEKNAIYIQEGGRVKEAQYGIEILANEITVWAKENGITNLKIMLPSGTGTTALFLQKFLDFEVLTCACVGDEAYLKEQFFQLNNDEKKHPTILKREKKYHFGKLYKEFYEEHKNLLQQCNIEFDLLYDSLGWITLQNYLKNIKNKTLPTILYIHQGGLLGNITMIERYQRKYKI